MHVWLYASQAPEGSQTSWLCPAMPLDESADPDGVLRAFLAVITMPSQSSYARILEQGGYSPYLREP